MYTFVVCEREKKTMKHIEKQNISVACSFIVGQSGLEI